MDPCGHVVDMLRSCYTVNMDFGNGQVYPVQWFFAADGADVLPYANAFNSSQWLTSDEKVGKPLGELPGRRTWVNGVNLMPTVDGRGPICAPQDWWMNAPPADAPTFGYGPDGAPGCCRPHHYWANISMEFNRNTPVPPDVPKNAFILKYGFIHADVTHS